MTIQVPKWLLGVIAVVAVAVAAFLIGRGTGDGGGSASSDGAQLADMLACDKAAAEAVITDHNPLVGFDGLSSPGDDALEFHSLKLVGCEDIDGDDVDEMIVRLYGQTASGLAPWMIYGARDGQWRLQLIRSMTSRDTVRLVDGVVRETRGAYAGAEPMCCPSGERVGNVSWDGSNYSYLPHEGIGDGRVHIADGEVFAIGGFATQTGSLDDAIQAFGDPTGYISEGEGCTASWTDTGLTINFVNLGGSDPCGRSGAVGSATIMGEAAELSGWRIDETELGVGSSQTALRQRYPRMKPVPADYYPAQGGEPGRDWNLVLRESPYADGRTPTLDARLDRGKAVGYLMYVGAGGE